MTYYQEQYKHHQAIVCEIVQYRIKGDLLQNQKYKHTHCENTGRSFFAKY